MCFVDASTSSSTRPGTTGAAQVDVQVPRLPRGLHTLARGPRVERLVEEVEVDRSPPAARARERDDLDPRSLAAAVGSERSRIDDDPGNLIGLRQPPLVEAGDDEAGYVVREVAGRIRASEQQKIQRQIFFFVGRQPQQLVAGERRGGQAREGVDPELLRLVDDVDALLQASASVTASGGRPEAARTRRSTLRKASADTSTR